MIVIGIDTTCDDTGVGIVADGYDILSNVIASQHGFHKPYGGIVPSIAARRHSSVINRIIEMALAEADLSFDSIDLVAVSSDQGLSPALAVGVAVAKSLSMAIDKPIVGLHHVEGHIYSNIMVHRGKLAFPFLCLTVAGGHTMILAAHQLGTYELLGSCRDDSAGEAYDKIARRLGLGYPGGPIIDKLAEAGNPEAFHFPRPMINKDSLDFSFSGLKSAVNRTIEELESNYREVPIEDLAASFQKAVIDVLISKIARAAESTGISRIAVAGGVAANSLLKSELETLAKAKDLSVFIPPKALCIDNGAMIAGLGFHAFMEGRRSDLNLDCRPNAPLGSLGIKYKPSTKYK